VPTLIHSVGVPDAPNSKSGASALPRVAGISTCAACLVNAEILNQMMASVSFLSCYQTDYCDPRDSDRDDCDGHTFSCFNSAIRSLVWLVSSIVVRPQKISLRSFP
jgi:hypothetical protein